MKSVKFDRDGRSWEVPEAFYRVSVKLIIKDADDKLLVLRDIKRDRWELPGGGLDHGETVLQCAAREIGGELGVGLDRMDESTAFLEPSLHPWGFWTIKIYYRAKLSSLDFTGEVNLEAKFVGRAEFAALDMPSDEDAAQRHVSDIWPA